MDEEKVMSGVEVRRSVCELVERTINETKALLDRLALVDFTPILPSPPPVRSPHTGFKQHQQKKKSRKHHESPRPVMHKNRRHVAPRSATESRSRTRTTLGSSPPPTASSPSPTASSVTSLAKKTSKVRVENLKNADGIVLCVDLNMKNVGSAVDGAKNKEDMSREVEDSGKRIDRYRSRQTSVSSTSHNTRDKKVQLRVEMPNFEPSRVIVNGTTFERID